jgi:hypothetical protein
LHLIPDLPEIHLAVFSGLLRGCSVEYIEEHYGQVQTEKMTDYITRTQSTMDDIDDVFLE